MPDFAHPTGESDREIKAQSAMEYLMTYSWTILIIAVVLGALFGLGVFNSGGFVGTSCTAASGYACQSPTLTTGGTLTFIAGENVGYIIYNVELECAASTAGGVPNPNAFNGIGATGAVLANVPDTTTGNSLSAGQLLTISSLPCYGSSGSMLGSQTIGTAFNGWIWLNYTKQAASHNAITNPWMTLKIAALRTSVS
jgi:hypothetical protein